MIEMMEFITEEDRRDGVDVAPGQFSVRPKTIHVNETRMRKKLEKIGVADLIPYRNNGCGEE